MLEQFKIKASERNNRLNIVLSGYFLMSEVELALHLMKRESKKLQSGFEVTADIRNFKTPMKTQESILLRIKKSLRLLGAGKVSYKKSNFIPPIFYYIRSNNKHENLSVFTYNKMGGFLPKMSGTPNN